MQSVFSLLDAILNFYQYIVIAAVVFSWLFAFNIINSGNQFVNMIWNFVNQLTEPVLVRIRRIIPSIGGIDLSPIVLLFAIMFIRSLLGEYRHSF
ncbi:MAG: YggT family protein [Cohaesibacteraceae bacterium]|nr:YggT family protein [Cohaesibacteraceae bacterium]